MLIVLQPSFAVMTLQPPFDASGVYLILVMAAFIASIPTFGDRP